MPLFTSGGLGLVTLVLVLVLRIWSCLHHWKWLKTQTVTLLRGSSINADGTTFKNVIQIIRSDAVLSNTHWPPTGDSHRTTGLSCIASEISWLRHWLRTAKFSYPIRINYPRWRCYYQNSITAFCLRKLAWWSEVLKKFDDCFDKIAENDIRTEIIPVMTSLC